MYSHTFLQSQESYVFVSVCFHFSIDPHPYPAVLLTVTNAWLLWALPSLNWGEWTSPRGASGLLPLLFSPFLSFPWLLFCFPPILSFWPFIFWWGNVQFCMLPASSHCRLFISKWIVRRVVRNITNEVWALPMPVCPLPSRVVRDEKLVRKSLANTLCSMTIVWKPEKLTDCVNFCPGQHGKHFMSWSHFVLISPYGEYCSLLFTNEQSEVYRSWNLAVVLGGRLGFEPLSV